MVGWFAQAARDLPWRKQRTPYTVVVSEFMLQQTQVSQVIEYFNRWMRLFPSWRELARAEDAVVRKAWEGLGYYSRATRLRDVARSVMDNHCGELPRDIDVLKKLPGFGDYTLGAVASMAFGFPLAAVDGNVARVLSRVAGEPDGWRDPSQRKSWRELAEKLLDRREPGLFNEALIELGATVCTPSSPRCAECPWQQWCPTAGMMLENRVAQSPKASKKIELSQRVAWVVYRGKLALKESAGPWWKGLWVLPPVEQGTGAVLASSAFTVTRHKVHLQVLQGTRSEVQGCVWHSLDQLEALAMPAPHRKVVNHLIGLD